MPRSLDVTRASAVRVIKTTELRINEGEEKVSRFSENWVSAGGAEAIVRAIVPRFDKRSERLTVPRPNH
jgi:hypothetical protein